VEPFSPLGAVLAEGALQPGQPGARVGLEGGPGGHRIELGEGFGGKGGREGFRVAVEFRVPGHPPADRGEPAAEPVEEMIAVAGGVLRGRPGIGAAGQLGVRHGDPDHPDFAGEGAEVGQPEEGLPRLHAEEG
jgi:hypothetical protein